jgi:hypothetical protein
LPSDLEYASFLNYSPRGASGISQSSKSFALKLKSNRIVTTSPRRSAAEYLVLRLWEALPGSTLAAFFSPDDTLVPVPASSQQKPGTVWPSLEIAQCMVERGLGGRVTRLLQRLSPMRKSAYSAPGARPGLEEHLATLEVQGGLDLGARVVLIDDLVTKGTTLLACALTIRSVHEGVGISGFAAFRTMGLQAEIERIVEPVRGRIWLDGSEVRRVP